mmetsp:Transcript_10814/g.15450  ORF Transcript_10814/g.15450 Transcript_10814/m.15450 type:complete len:239 (+) Transcript_10814:532-1248(+)
MGRVSQKSHTTFNIAQVQIFPIKEPSTSDFAWRRLLHNQLDNFTAICNHIIDFAFLLFSCQNRPTAASQIIGSISTRRCLVRKHIRPSMLIWFSLAAEEHARLIFCANDSDRCVPIVFHVFLGRSESPQFIIQLTTRFDCSLSPPALLTAIVERIVNILMHLLSNSTVYTITCEKSRRIDLRSIFQFHSHKAIHILIANNRCIAAQTIIVNLDISIITFQIQSIQQGMLQNRSTGKAK